MFGSKKRIISRLKEAIKKYEDEAADLLPALKERESILRELRAILSVPDGQDIRVYARSLILDRESTLISLESLVSSMKTIEDSFRKKEKKPKAKKAKKSVLRRRN
jgi:hypothetical protein